MKEELIIEHLKKIYSDKDTTNFDLLDFVGAFGSIPMALAYSKLFWPDFVEFYEMIFLKDIFELEDYIKKNN